MKKMVEIDINLEGYVYGTLIYTKFLNKFFLSVPNGTRLMLNSQILI